MVGSRWMAGSRPFSAAKGKLSARAFGLDRPRLCGGTGQELGSAGGVPDDDLLGRIVAGRRRHVAVDRAELGGAQAHRDVLLAGVLRDPVPAGAELGTILARNDAVVRLVVLGL